MLMTPCHHFIPLEDAANFIFYMSLENYPIYPMLGNYTQCHIVSGHVNSVMKKYGARLVSAGLVQQQVFALAAP